MKRKSPNTQEIYIAADTEAQTVVNDEKLNRKINVDLKGVRAVLEHELKYDPDDTAKVDRLKQINKQIDQLSPGLCNVLNPYLIGWAPIDKRSMIHYDQDVNVFGDRGAQDRWVHHHVRWKFEPDPEISVWQWFLDDLYKHFRQKIKKGGQYKLIIYFHNLDYDGQQFLQVAMDQLLTYPILIDSVLHNGTLYSVSFRYRDCLMELRDSMKIYNQSLAKLGKNVGWSKKTEKATYTWFDLYKDKKRLKNEEYYFKYDIAVLAAVMRNHFEKLPGRSRLTAAGYAEADLKRQVHDDDKWRDNVYFNDLFKPCFTPEQEQFLRSAYFGGFVYAQRDLVNKHLKNGLVADVNSLYPSVMLNRDYPSWRSLQRISEKEVRSVDLHDYHVYIVARVHVLKLEIKPDGVPCVPKKSAYGISQEIYSIDDLATPYLTLTNLDLYWIGKNYDFKYKVVFAIAARRYLTAPFKQFVLKHKKEKEDAVARGNKVDKMIAKIHLNSVYGKFAQRQINTKTELLRNSDGSIGFTEVVDPKANPTQHNILIAVFVTAFARDILLDMIYRVKHEKLTEFWYCDTDAVHFGYKGKLNIVKDAEQIFTDAGFPYSPNVFGKWKPENRMRDAIYLGSKRYWEQDPTMEAAFQKKMSKDHKPFTQLDVIKAGAVIKGAGIQKAGKSYLVEQGFNEFHYGKDHPLVVPFNVSKKIVGGVKIYDSIKLIEPTPTTWNFLNHENIL